MSTFAICEDEAYFADKLKMMLVQYLQNRSLDAEILIFSSGEDLVRSGGQPDVVLMDVKLPGMNGMEIVEYLQREGKSSQVIFITAYKKYVFQAFDLDAVHYLLKPVREEKLYSALDRARKRIADEDGKALWVTRGAQAVRIRFQEILYCEVFDHEVLIHTGREHFRSSKTLDTLEKELDGRFFRCHRSYLVNMNRVMEKEAGAALVAGGGRVLVSRRREQEFQRRLLKSCREWEV